jgi:tripartite-type tricarboxylate transporter receptor subunit TctC
MAPLAHEWEGTMNLGRRRFLRLAACAAAMPAASRIATAQSYPMRQVRIFVPFAAGGNVDLIARMMGQLLSERLGQPFIIENRAGAGTNIGTEAVVRAPADGYTLLLVSPPAAINATLYEKLNFNFIRDIAPVASLIRAPFVMEVNASVPAETVPEFIAYAKSNPDKVNMASAGVGSGPHLAGELFKIMSGTNIPVVHYRGAGPALNDLIGGQVQLYFDAIPASIEHIRVGSLRPLAVTTPKRSELLPETPPLSDFLTGYDVHFWSGIGAPKKTPDEVVDRLNREINAVLADPKVMARIADLGGTAHPGSPSDFGKFIADETERWAKVIRAANIKPE